MTLVRKSYNKNTYFFIFNNYNSRTQKISSVFDAQIELETFKITNEKKRIRTCVKQNGETFNVETYYCDWNIV